jgi:hypothetical protein
MQVLDPTRWGTQEIELKADAASRKFLEFFTTWFDKAEALMADTARHRMSSMAETLEDSRVESCVRDAYVVTELKLGYLSMEWIGQMLLIASEHWVHGAEMVKGLSVLETRMLEQMTAIKLAELQEAAAAKL